MSSKTRVVTRTSFLSQVGILAEVIGTRSRSIAPSCLFSLYCITSFLLDYLLPFRQGGWGRALLPNIDQSTGLAFE